VWILFLNCEYNNCQNLSVAIASRITINELTRLGEVGMHLLMIGLDKDVFHTRRELPFSPD
jgi:hypothetical protein